jgi:hypothetical protein
MSSIIDSYSFSNFDSAKQLNAEFPNALSACSQSVTTPDNGYTYTLTDLDWFLADDPEYAPFKGTLVAEIYEHSGTYGTDSVLTGDALAVSDELTYDGETTVLSQTPSAVTFTFTGDQQIELSQDTHYIIVLKITEYTSGQINVCCDESTPIHSSNPALYQQPEV